MLLGFRFRRVASDGQACRVCAVLRPVRQPSGCLFVLHELKFRLFPRDFEGVGSYRVIYPYGFLEANTDHECTFEVDGQVGNQVRLCFPDPKTEEADGDVYVLQIRWERIVPGVIDWLHSQGKAVVVELDDWYHGMHPSNPAVESLRKRKHIDSLEALTRGIYKADLVTVSTPRLGELYGRMNPNVAVLPNYLRWANWTDVTPAFEQDRRVRVGWQGTMKWRGDDLSVLRGLIRPFLERNPHVDFVSVGDKTSVVHDYLDIPLDRRLQVQGNIFPRHTRPTATIDIGLVPLSFTEFNECKSCLKGMEYAACGIPCVASKTVPYRDWVDEGVNGFLARKPKDWLRHLELLVNDDDLRRQMGRNAFQKVQSFTFESGRWQEWNDLYSRWGLSTCSTSDTSVSSSGQPVLATST